MDIFIGFFIGFLIVIFVSMFIMSYTLDYSVHKDQVKEFCKTYRKISFKEFKELFDSTQWYYNKMWKDSLFDVWDCETCDHRGEIHANVFKFNYEGVIFRTLFDYRKAIKYVKKCIAKNTYLDPNPNDGYFINRKY